LDQYVRKNRRAKGVARRVVVQDPDSESGRWLQAFEAVERRAAGRFGCIHVADREGDMFMLMSGATEIEARFVIRATYDRRIVEDGEAARLHEPLLRLKPCLSRQIQVTKRDKSLTPAETQKRPVRNAREATVAMAATTVTLVRPSERGLGAELDVNIVRVWEPAPPPGQPAVEWMLYTSESVDTPEEIERVVDIYRARWTIEEYFKALKSGCAVEKRQLETFDTLSNAVAIFAPIAWRMLLTRSVARAHPAQPAVNVLSATQIPILELKLKRRIATAKDAFLAVARLGGHLSQNGAPGWQTLGRGFEELLTAEHYFLLGQAAARCDQS
jgi:hypothetical protein